MRWTAVPGTKGSIPDRDRVKDRFSVLPGQHLCRLISVCLALCVQTKTVEHVKDPVYNVR